MTLSLPTLGDVLRTPDSRFAQLPDFPWDSLVPFRELAAAHLDGLVELASRKRLDLRDRLVGRVGLRTVDGRYCLAVILAVWSHVNHLSSPGKIRRRCGRWARGEPSHVTGNAVAPRVCAAR